MESASRVVSQQAWVLAACLEHLRVTGRLTAQADVARLAVAIIAALQGGYVLAQLARDSRPLADALDMALARVRALAPQRS